MDVHDEASWGSPLGCDCNIQSKDPLKCNKNECGLSILWNAYLLEILLQFLLSVRLSHMMHFFWTDDKEEFDRG